MDQNYQAATPSIFLRLFGKIQSKPIFKLAFFKFMYGIISRASIKEKEMVFMNYGYSNEGFDERVKLLEHDEADRYSIQLYEYLIHDTSLEGKDVLEVGCGRGGGVSYVARYKLPRLVTGLDLSNTQIKFCKDLHAMQNVQFTQGSALELPFEDDSYNAVINVESSHCYPSLSGFYEEVYRVLEPGGIFYYTDFIPKGSSESQSNVTDVVEQKLKASGFEDCIVEDITDNVIAALNHTDQHKRDMFSSQLSNPFMKKTLNDLLATKDSKSYQLFLDKESIYFSIRARKPHEHES